MLERNQEVQQTSNTSMAPDTQGAAEPKQPMTWVFSAIVAIALLYLVALVVRNPNFQWDVVTQYLFDTKVLKGLLVTIELTVIAMTIGILLGVVLVMGRLSDNAVLRGVAGAYIWFFRGTPQLVQLIFWFNVALIIPNIGLGVPFGPMLFSVSANDVITPFVAAIIGLGLHEAAYQTEIYRGGLLSVDEGQAEAAKALGMTSGKIFIKIQMPQAMRFIVPPTFSQLIGMLKATSLVAVIGGAELLFSVQQIYSLTFETIPLLIVACIWYLVATTILNFIQFFIERYYGRGSSSQASKGVLNNLFDRYLQARENRRKAA